MTTSGDILLNWHVIILKLRYSIDDKRNVVIDRSKKPIYTQVNTSLTMYLTYCDHIPKSFPFSFLFSLSWSFYSLFFPPNLNSRVGSKNKNSKTRRHGFRSLYVLIFSSKWTYDTRTDSLLVRFRTKEWGKSGILSTLDIFQCLVTIIFNIST